MIWYSRWQFGWPSVFKERKILSDAQNLIEATNQLMINKNPDEKLQKFIEASAKVTQDAASTASSEMYVLEIETESNFRLKCYERWSMNRN